uniref:Elongation of very long chain fatty acids protein n=1 Tax=Meloidogyne incognita TaxID=6306 RepID=A0A914MN91_MELIC
MTSYNNNNTNNFEIWKNSEKYGGSKIYFIPYKYEELWSIEEKLWNAEFTHGMFTKHWHFSIYIVMAYIAGVYSLKKWMEDRKAFDLRLPLFFWNVGLSIFSTCGAWRFGHEFFYVLLNRGFQDSICLSFSPAEPVAFWAMCFALSKIAEFGDTVFLLLRKRPLIFLHWFHHAVVLIYSWHSATELTAAGRWFIQLNYMVHSVMYAYYAAACIGIRAPKWISMSVTAMQTTQMLIGVFISLYVAYLKGTQDINFVCQQSVQNMCICFTIYSAFAVLFTRFFVKAYIQKGERRKITLSNNSVKEE